MDGWTFKKPGRTGPARRRYSVTVLSWAGGTDVTGSTALSAAETRPQRPASARSAARTRTTRTLSGTGGIALPASARPAGGLASEFNVLVLTEYGSLVSVIQVRSTEHTGISKAGSTQA